MPFKLIFSNKAGQNFIDLEKNKALLKQFKATKKALGYLEKKPSPSWIKDSQIFIYSWSKRRRCI